MLLERKSYLAFVMLGMIAPVNGLALPYLIGAYNLSLSWAGLLFFAGSLGYITASATYPLLQRLLAVRQLLAVGAVLTAGGLLVLPLMPNWWLVLVASYVVGMGSSVIDVGFNALIADLESERAKPAMNWLHFAFSIGALAGPIVMSRLALWTGQWMVMFWLGTVLFILFTIMWLQTQTVVEDTETSEGSHSQAPSVYSHWGFWLLFAAMFVYCGAETALAGWITTYLASEMSVSVDTAAFGLSLLWGGLTVGRALGGKFSNYLDTKIMLLLLFGGSAVSTAAVVAVPNVWSAFITIFLTGFFFSVIFPALMLHGAAMFPKSASIISGGLITSAGLGALVMPALLGFVAEKASLAVGILIVAGLLLVSVGISAALPTERSLTPKQGQTGRM